MSIELKRFTEPDCLTILPTFRCTAACQDCCTGSNPKVEGRIPQQRILKYIKDGAELGIKKLVFSGGEAFLLGNDLDESILYATKLGMRTRVVTNGYWAIDEKIARERLSRLKANGLCEINFSTGDFHQKFVSINNIVNGGVASISVGLTCVIVIEIRKGRSFTKEQLIRDKKISKILRNPNENKMLKIIETPWMPVYDSEFIPQDKELLVNAENIHQRKGCHSILSTFTVDPYEKMGACCGLTRQQIPEMNLGSLKEKTMKELISSGFEDFMKIWLYVDGPEKILAWAASKDSSIEWENKFAHTCHSCREVYHNEQVRKTIKKFHHEKLLDVYFKYWLLANYNLDTKTTDKL